MNEPTDCTHAEWRVTPGREKRAENVAAMRADPAAQAAIGRVVDLCESATPGPCRLVAHLEVNERAGRRRADEPASACDSSGGGLDLTATHTGGAASGRCRPGR